MLLVLGNTLRPPGPKARDLSLPSQVPRALAEQVGVDLGRADVAAWRHSCAVWNSDYRAHGGQTADPERVSHERQFYRASFTTSGTDAKDLIASCATGKLNTRKRTNGEHATVSMCRASSVG